MKLSFIIPTKGRETLLKECIHLIHVNMKAAELCYEIIIIDNSLNGVGDIINNKVNEIIRITKKNTIAQLRNYGVEQSTGDILIFIDDDVWLSTQWGINIKHVLTLLEENYKIVTGSLCSINENNPTWIDKAWFLSMSSSSTSATLGSAHLIMTRRLFEELNGFNPSLETGEDSDICLRSVKHGGKIINSQELKAFHMGNPDTIIKFFRRERWHGKGNFSSDLIFNKMTIFIMLLLLSFVLSIIGFIMSNILVISYPVAAIFLSFPIAFKHFNTIKYLFHSIFLSWLLLTARGFSLFDVISDNLKTRITCN